MLFDKIEQYKEFSDDEIKIPSYITDNLRYPLYDWQKEALENFLINERMREKKAKKSFSTNEPMKPNHLMFNMATGSGKTLVMAALILYYYKAGYRNFIFFVNQNAILGKTQANFIDSAHNKYLFKENVVIDGKRITFREVDMFSDNSDDAQIKFTTIQKLHNDIYKESENSLLLSDLQKRDIILFGDEAHHLNASTNKKIELSDSVDFLGELKESAKDEDIERSWEYTILHCILQKDGKNSSLNKNALMEFTATIPNTKEVQQKYEDKIIMKFELKDFVEAGCTKHIRLVRSNLELKERVLQALLLNYYRYEIATKAGIANFKGVILFRSKNIEDSKRDYEWFLELCKNVNADSFGMIHAPFLHEEQSYLFDKNIFSRIVEYMSSEKKTFENVAQYIRENFQERNVIITNSKTNKTKKEKTDSETDRLLNSLESPDNHIRAIFTVQRLTEGWDVLNLFDIVRLYSGRDTDFKAKKAGNSTTSEVQLIGRGVRYFPFSYKDKASAKRKFDDDLTNPLLVLEEFYFHSDGDNRYISELSAELKNRGLISEKRTQKTFSVKKEKQEELKGMYLFVNEQKENPNRRLKTLPEDFRILPAFEKKIVVKNFSEIRSVDFSQNEDSIVNSENSVTTKTFCKKFSDIPRQIKYKALHLLNTNPLSYFSFENLRKRFDVKSADDFFDFIKDVEINIISDVDFDEIPNKKILKLCKEFLLYVQTELETYDNPFVGTDFKLVKFSDMFTFDSEKGKVSFTKEKMILIDDENAETKENKQLEKDLQAKDWYVLNAFWGTSEERELVEFIKSRESNLFEKYDSFQLLRNEEIYKIFDFDTGRGFMPDFLLFLHGKETQNCYYQVFIEPKGAHLAGADNDGWKEDFLEKITNRYGKENVESIAGGKYILLGLPFFNATDKEMKATFARKFETQIF